MDSTSRLTLNLHYPNIAQVAYAMQGDRLSRAVGADLVDGSTPWAPPSGAYGLITASKPDGTFAVYDTLEDGSPAIVIAGSTVTLYLAEQVLTDAGAVKMSVSFFTAAGARLTTFRWTEVVAPEDVLDRVVSGNYISIFTATMAEAAEIFQQIKAAYGAPLTANTAGAMTDTTRVYVYTGTTGGGYTNGHWYYWNGSAWTDGGNYNSTGFTTDKTLSIEDAAADAAATGDVRYEFEINMDNTLCPVDALSWEQGGFIRTTGAPGDSDSIIRTTEYIPSNVVRVSCPATQEMCLYAWDDTTDEFVGHEISSGVFATNAGGLMRSDCVIDWSKGYKYKLIMTNLDHSTEILPSAGANAIPYVATDETLTESGKAADAKATGDAIKELTKYNAVDLLKDNLLHYNTSYNGVVYRWSSDLSYLTVNGTATGQSWCHLFDSVNTMPNGIEAGKTYYVKVEMPVNNLYLTIRQFGENNTLISQIDADGPSILTIDPACIGMEIRIQAVVGTTYNNVIVSEFAILNADSNLGLSERLNNVWKNALPAVTSADAGKVLMVDADGNWVVASLP